MAFNLNKVGGVMFGFTKRHEQDWRLTRLEEMIRLCLKNSTE
ncbi:putative phage protein [Staphylococcus aureus]|nr:putative phage protein [Staphylococcus aureus]